MYGKQTDTLSARDSPTLSSPPRLNTDLHLQSHGVFWSNTSIRSRFTNNTLYTTSYRGKEEKATPKQLHTSVYT